MSAGDATAADVPGKYDCVINGKGYCLLDSLEESIPFRTHRAVYGFTPPFVERQNVSNQYGDNTQDFFLTIRQRDWSLGEQQKFFRSSQDGRYWMGSSVDVGTPGQVKLSQTATALTFAGAVSACTRDRFTDNTLTSSSTNLYQVDPTGTITDEGAHGLGVVPARWGMVNDGTNAYMSSTATGTVGVRKWSGSAFSTFSATPSDSLAFVNNTLYGFRSDTSVLQQYDTAGTATTLFPWKQASGGFATAGTPRIHTFGGKLLLAFNYGVESSELWIYDGSGVFRLEVFPENFIINDIDVVYGVAYISGSFMRKTAGSYFGRPAVLFFDGSQIGKLWQANDYGTVAISGSTIQDTLPGPHPALGVNDGRLIFTDDTTGNIMAYDPARGGVSSIASFSAGGTNTEMASTGSMFLHTRNATKGYFFPSGSYPSSGYVISSLIDFDSSLKKVFRGITVEFDAASDGNGGTVDVSYQLDSVSGSFTSLATGVTSGTEVTLPANTAGHAIAVKITINKGTSTAGPIVKSYNVRGAPIMPQYPHGEYILDCTNTEDAPRTLRDGSYHPLTGYAQAQNLVTAAKSTTPISITDKMSGTFTGFVDINDPQGFDVYEIHPAEDNLKNAGSYVIRLTVRGV